MDKAMEHNNVTPKALNLSKAKTQQFGEEVSRIAYIKHKNIKQFVEFLGGTIKVGSSGNGDLESGSIVARELNDFTIYLSPHTSLKRDRFTIAHELGHLFLHLNSIKEDNAENIMRATRWVDEEDTSQQRAEWEANWFAAAFLMPSEEFSEVVKASGVETAALTFDVSYKAAEVRASSLGLL